MKRPARKFPEGWSAGMVFLRFVLAAFFGFLLGVTVLLLLWPLWPDEHLSAAPWVLLVGLPALSGLLGIFFFQKVIGDLRQAVEEAWQDPWWRW